MQLYSHRSVRITRLLNTLSFAAGGGGVCLLPGGCLLRGRVWRPPPKADGYCCGRYASYWNAFLFSICFSILHIERRRKLAQKVTSDLSLMFANFYVRVRLQVHENNSENDIAFIWVFKKFNVLFTLTGDSDQRKFSLSPTVNKPKMIPFINLWPSCRQYCLCFMWKDMYVPYTYPA